MKKMNIKTISQKIYTSTYADELYLQRTSSSRLEQYAKKDFSFLDETRTVPIEIEIVGEEPNLIIESGDKGSLDGKNAEKFFNAYQNINIDLAMDKNFWTYLAHNNFRSYVLNRFGSQKEGTIKERFFTQAYFSDRRLERNAIARLWWAGYLTTNFDNDPELEYFFKDKKDPYFFTKILCDNQNLFVQALGHSFGRWKKILIATLQHTYNNRAKLKGKKRPYALYISNRICLYEQNQSLIYCNPDEIMKILEEIATVND